jgi:hypothetical protein
MGGGAFAFDGVAGVVATERREPRRPFVTVVRCCFACPQVLNFYCPREARLFVVRRKWKILTRKKL